MHPFKKICLDPAEMAKKLFLDCQHKNWKFLEWVREHIPGAKKTISPLNMRSVKELRKQVKQLRDSTGVLSLLNFMSTASNPDTYILAFWESKQSFILYLKNCLKEIEELCAFLAIEVDKIKILCFFSEYEIDFDDLIKFLWKTEESFFLYLNSRPEEIDKLCYFAIKFDKLKILKFFYKFKIEISTDINIDLGYFYNNSMPMPSWIASKGSLDTFSFLLNELKINCNEVKTCNQGHGLLYYIIESSVSPLEKLELLLNWYKENQQDITKDISFVSALFKSLRTDLKMLELLSLQVQDLSLIKKDNHTLLEEAILSNNEQAVELLINTKKIDLNKKSNNDTDSAPLQYAVQANKKKILELLINAGADIQVKWKNGNKIISALIEKFSRDRSNETDILGSIELIINALDMQNISKQDILDDQNDEGETALFLALKKGALQIVDYLITVGANPDIKNENAIHSADSSCLHYTVTHNLGDVLNLLINAGANINIKDNNNDTPAHMAAYRFFAEILKKLQRAGADSTIKNNQENRVEDYFILGIENNSLANPQEIINTLSVLVTYGWISLDEDNKDNFLNKYISILKQHKEENEALARALDPLNLQILSQINKIENLSKKGQDYINSASTKLSSLNFQFEI